MKKGDTLYGISNQFGVSVTELAQLNNVNASTLKIGQFLKIPVKSGTNPDAMFMYTVKAGDTLYNIARVYGTTVDDIKKLNYFTTNNLSVGQIIRIPEIFTKQDEFFLPEFINYVVKRGDNLYSIAKKYDLDVDTILQDNALKNTNLSIGQNLKIRIKSTNVIDECFGEDFIIPSNLITNTYVVQKGDSLYSIAKKYNVSVSDLLNYNDLPNSILSIGQKLVIPSNNNPYTVKKGDTLYSIAKKFNTSINDIISKNSLKSNVLSIGQIINV